MSNTQDSVRPHFKVLQSFAKCCALCYKNIILTLRCVWKCDQTRFYLFDIIAYKLLTVSVNVLMLFILFLVNLDDSKKKWFLEFYKRMCNCGNPNKNNRVGSVTLALQV